MKVKFEDISPFWLWLRLSIQVCHTSTFADEIYNKSSLSTSNLAISSSSKLIHASIPFPDLVSKKVTMFLLNNLAEPIHTVFPHAKSASYTGNLHRLVKAKVTPSPFFQFLHVLFQKLHLPTILLEFFHIVLVNFQ